MFVMLPWRRAQLATQVICESRPSTAIRTPAQLFCETNKIFSAAIEAPPKATLEGEGAKILKTMESPVIARAAVLW